jgi:hexosaminidase
VCPKCIETRYANNLKDEHELQSYFIRRIEKFLNSKGRQIIGWDEILEGGLAPNATVMSWRGTEGGIAAAREKHDVVMTPGSHCYFDHYQGERGSEPLAIGGYTPLEKVYAYRPIPSELKPEEHRYILGAQANVWTEYMPDSAQVEYMLLPRLCALSEVLWTDTLRHDEQEFYDRVLRHQRLLDRWKVNYSTTWMAPTLRVEPGPEVPSLRLGLESKFPQTIEWAWSTPETKVRLMPYEGPFVATSSGTLMVRSTAGNVVKQLSFPFEFSNSTGAGVELSVPGDRNYNNPAFTLCDGQTGSYPWSGKQWVGWIGKNAEVNIDLGGEKEVDSVVVTVLHDPVSWIHAPGSIVINVGTTTVASGVTGRETGLMRIVLPVKIKTRNLQVGFLSLGKNPEGSAGAGEDGWMFVSEIQVY